MHGFNTRDEVLAEDVAAMTALGKFEREFTAYGCAFYDNGQVVLAVGSDAESVYDWMHDSSNINSFATCCHRASIRSLVPAGMEESLKQEVEQQLIDKLFALYPVEYFRCLQSISEVVSTNTAEPFLRKLCFQLDGVCGEESLALFRGLLEKAYQRKILEASSYYEFIEWVHWTERDLEVFSKQHDTYEKTFYSFAYCSEHGPLRIFVDGNKVNTYERFEQKCMEGNHVSNIIARTCCYNHHYSIVDSKHACTAYLKNVFDENYRHALLTIETLPTPLRQDYYDNILSRYINSKKLMLAEGLQRQANIWKL